MWYWFIEHNFMTFWIFVLMILILITSVVNLLIALKIWFNLLETEGS